MPAPRRLPRFARIGITTVGIGLVLAAIVAFATPALVRGRRYGRVVEMLLPRLRGQIHVGGGTWSWGAIVALLRGAPAPVTMTDVRITDPEGTEVLWVRNLSARIEVHRSPTRIRVTDLRLEEARWRFARMHGEDRAGFLAALAEASPGRGSSSPSQSPSRGTEFSMGGVRLEGLEATFEFPDWGLRLADVHGAGALALRSGAFTFEVTGAEARAGGTLRIGAWKQPLSFQTARLDRVATTPDAPDALRLEASNIAVGRSRVDGASTFDGIYGVSRASRRPGMTAEIRAHAAADLINVLAAGLTSWHASPSPGSGGSGDILVRLSGPFQALAIAAEVRGVDLDRDGQAARDVRFDLTAEPSTKRFRLRGLSLTSPEGGRIAGDITVDGPRVDGDLSFAGFAPRPYLPALLRPFGDGVLDGRLRGHLDLQASTFGLDLATLVLRGTGARARDRLTFQVGTAATKAPARTTGPTIRISDVSVAEGAVRLGRLAASWWGARFVASGQVRLWDAARAGWLDAPLVSIDASVSRLALERLTGVGFARGALSFTARARGSADDLTVALTFPPRAELSVLGEPFSLPHQIPLTLTGSWLATKDLRLAGPRGSDLHATGGIALSGKLAVDVGIDAFPLDRLPGFERTALPLSGLMSGEIHVGGTSRTPIVRGRATLDPVTFQGRHVGAGSIAITPTANGGIRAHGRLIDVITVDGVLAVKQAGLAGEATVTLDHLRMDPFLPTPLEGVSATGLLSGVLTARIGPGQPAIAEGALSELTLVVASTEGRGRPTRPVELHADGGVPISARSGAGPITIGPARFRGNAGTFELWGESRGDAARGTLRGRIELAPFAPFAARSVQGLAGAIDFDLAAASGGEALGLRTTGTVTIATPLSFRLVEIPVAALVSAGHVTIDGDVVATSDLLIAVHAERVPFAPITRLDGRGRLVARVTNLGLHPKLNARLAVDRLDLGVPALGAAPVRATGGAIEIGSRRDTIAITSVDVPLQGGLHRLDLPPVFVDEGTFLVRVQGVPDRALRLSGTVTLDAARIRAADLKAGASGTLGGKSAARGSELERVALDLRLRAPDGAVVVDVPNVPDLRVGLDMHVGGTAAKPTLSGEPHGSTVYSRFALALWRLFR